MIIEQTTDQNLIDLLEHAKSLTERERIRRASDNKIADLYSRL